MQEAGKYDAGLPSVEKEPRIIAIIRDSTDSLPIFASKLHFVALPPS
jgi:hypothetical protein